MSLVRGPGSAKQAPMPLQRGQAGSSSHRDQRPPSQCTLHQKGGHDKSNRPKGHMQMEGSLGKQARGQWQGEANDTGGVGRGKYPLSSVGQGGSLRLVKQRGNKGAMPAWLESMKAKTVLHISRGKAEKQPKKFVTILRPTQPG